MKVVAWIAAGIFFAVAAIGGAKVAPFAAIACGWFAGRNTTERTK